ncbi:ABC transporter [Cellvibrio zantedeschiae]|uniref:ABC transporter n=1 Tax=Cellvibrio zantedeschiae TaxID=1237077 RepID=A0ABQ3B5D4_9GAMM|nr:ABC transporter ATP-binding protein [Cellvibrio zantedeschiae]GGY79012.1 ABC transporter [Cellvibrio zantedeschiae]
MSLSDAATPLAIECKGITKNYPHFRLQNVDLAFEQGTVMGLVGPNGAGKSTILRIVMGLIAPDSGSVNVLGRTMPSEQLKAKRDIGFIAEDMRLYESETIEFHMNFIKSIFDSWDAEYAKHLLKRFDLNKAQKVKGLSHGQRVKATLLLALARRPKLLVFDEPTTGLDPAVRKEVLDAMMNALSDETHSILFSSHNTLDIEQISDYITFIYGGQVVESRNKEDFIDGWRRLRLTNMHNNRLPQLQNITDVQQNGRLCTLTVNNYEDSIPEQLTSAGLMVDAIERLTLEEIFLSNVHHAKSNKKMELAR